MHHRSINSEIIFRLEQSFKVSEPPYRIREPADEYQKNITFPQTEFLASYQAEHHYASQSDVIRDALNLLQQTELASSYKEANAEIDKDFDATSGDGINDETW